VLHVLLAAVFSFFFFFLFSLSLSLSFLISWFFLPFFTLPLSPLPSLSSSFFQGMGTDDQTLVRIVVTRSEVDMVEIKQAFLTNYHKTLAKMITDDCSGDYKRMLVALVGE